MMEFTLGDLLDYFQPDPVYQLDILRSQGGRVGADLEAMGFALVRPKSIHIGINRNLKVDEQRMAVAHEVGHIIANQPGQLFVCRSSDWSKEKDEREAHLIAACLLVPLRVVAENYYPGSIGQLARALKVPPDLVELRWSFARVHGDI